jgi:hypothetical protein
MIGTHGVYNGLLLGIGIDISSDHARSSTVLNASRKMLLKHQECGNIDIDSK